MQASLEDVGVRRSAAGWWDCRFTSGPVIFFLAISSGTTFAASAIAGTISGGFSLVAFCLVYAWLAIRFDWRISLTVSMLAYFGIVLLMENIIIPFAPLIVAVTLTIAAWSASDAQERDDAVE